MGLFRYMDKRADEYAEENIPRKNYSSPSKKSAKEIANDKASNGNPRFQQLIEDLNAFKSTILKFLFKILIHSDFKYFGKKIPRFKLVPLLQQSL